jgi:hypothetical protein
MKVYCNNVWHSVAGLDAVGCELCVAVLSYEELGLEISWEDKCFNRTSVKMVWNSRTEVDFESSIELTGDMIKVWAFMAPTIL